MKASLKQMSIVSNTVVYSVNLEKDAIGAL